MSMRLVIASGNPGKLREFDALLRPLGFDAVAQAALGIDDTDEPHCTFVENALRKARHASAASGTAALADDSGLCVEALGGLPGVRSARYADDESGAGEAGGDRRTRDGRNNAKLLAALAGATSRNAYFVSVIVLLRSADDPEPIVAVGRWHGAVVDAPRGANGFGYDPYFVGRGLERTAAELDLATKNRISHRAIALRRLVDELVARGAIRDGAEAASGADSGAGTAAR